MIYHVKDSHLRNLRKIERGKPVHTLENNGDQYIFDSFMLFFLAIILLVPIVICGVKHFVFSYLGI